LKSGELANRKARKAQAIADYEKAREAGDVEMMQKMADRTATVTPEITAQTKKLLMLMGVAIVNAPCEAEATCAELAQKGLCHAAATEDADALTFGANILIRNIFSTDLKKRPMFEVNLSRCLEQLDVDMETFIDFCILSGCDYTNTIKGVGSKTAFQVRREKNRLLMLRVLLGNYSTDLN
jgi:flap endonuclease-1